MNKILNKTNIIVLLKMALILLVGLVFAVLFMTLVFLIPQSSMMDNATKSYYTLKSEGEYYNNTGYDGGQRDNYTDASMIAFSTFIKQENSAIENAMLANNKGHAFYGLNAVITNSDDAVCDYSRYWHGYMIFLKPLLVLFDYSTIRIINTVLQILLVFIISILIFKKCKKVLIPYLASLLFINPYVISQSLQFSSVYYIFNFAILCILLFYDKLKIKNRFCYMFLIIGMATTFFDLLTYPMATLTMPLLFVIWFDKSETFKDKLILICKLAFCWAIGYFGFWALKWIVGSLICKKNLIRGALEQASMRTMGNINYAPSQILVRLAFLVNVYPFFSWGNLVLFVALLITYIVIITTEKKFKASKKIFITYFVVALMAVLWYLVLSNHSYMHYWFTYRSYVGTIFAVMLMLVSFLDKRANLKKNIGEINNEKNSSNNSVL